MQLTVMVKLLTDERQARSLRKTLCAVNSACDWISQQALKAKTFTQFPLHKLAYYRCRKEFPSLSAQAVVRAIGKVVDAYKLDCNVQRRFKPLGSFPYDERLLSWNFANDTVSVWSIDGRMKNVRFVAGAKQREMLNFERGQADLVCRSGIFYLFVSVNLPETKTPACKEWLGIDLGLVNLAQSSDGQTFGDARKVAGIRARRWRQRKRLQKKGTRSARRVIHRLSRRESRMMKLENHVISKQICAVAERTKRGIALEDLKGIRSRIRAGKIQRRILHSWAFADLQSKIAYKGRLIGVPVKFVDAKNTSRQCLACGHVSKKNRPTRDKFACQSCGFTADADTNAAGNISRRGAIILPNERASVCVSDAHVQNPPFMVG